LESKPNLVSTGVNYQKKHLWKALRWLNTFLDNQLINQAQAWKVSDIVDAICEMHSCRMKMELSKHKLALMKQQEVLMLKEEQNKEKEEKCN